MALGSTAATYLLGVKSSLERPARAHPCLPRNQAGRDLSPGVSVARSAAEKGSMARPQAGHGRAGIGRSFPLMSIFCDVVLPVPLDRAFTYKLKGEDDPPVGGRVVVPFRNEKLIGVVTRLHDEAPPVEARPIEAVLDQEPILNGELMELAAWIAQYYVVPLGEVLRSMLPLMAEVRRSTSYRISETGKAILFDGAQQGSSRRSRRTADEQNIEYTVLDYLSDGQPAKSGTLRHATGATAELLTSMLRKKWLLRETEAAPRDARRMLRYAVLVADARPPKLNNNQLAILAELAGAGGELPVPALTPAGPARDHLANAGEAGFGYARRTAGGVSSCPGSAANPTRAQPCPASSARPYRGRARWRGL